MTPSAYHVAAIADKAMRELSRARASGNWRGWYWVRVNPYRGKRSKK